MHPHPVSAPAMNSKYQVSATHAGWSVLLIILAYLLLMNQAFSSNLISPVSLKIKSSMSIYSRNKPGVKLDYEGCLREGSHYRSGGYFIYVAIGTPAKGYMLFVDTASDLTWIQSSTCNPCYEFPPNHYSAAASGSSVYVGSKEHGCDILLDLRIPPTDLKIPPTDDICTYKAEYMDDTSSIGLVVRETLAIGGNLLVDHVIGVGVQNSRVSGILGLGSGESSFVSQAKVKSFSHCFVSWGSDEESTMEFNIKSPHTFDTSIQILHMDAYTNYFVDLREIRVGDQSIPISEYDEKKDAGGTIIDTGSFTSSFPSTVFQSFQDGIISFTSASPVLNRVQPYFDGPELCYSGLPPVPVTLIFGIGNTQKSLIIPYANIFMKVEPQDRPAIYCIAFRQRRRDTDYSVIGNFFLQHFRVYYDLERQEISFVGGMC